MRKILLFLFIVAALPVWAESPREIVSQQIKRATPTWEWMPQVVRRRPVFTAGAWTPDSLGSTLKLWWESDNGTGGVSDGDKVSTWTDLSGEANDGTASGTQRPTYKTNQINSLPAVRFEASTFLEYLNIPNSFSALTEIQAFLVVKLEADPPAAGAYAGLWLFSSTSTETLFPFTDNTIYDSFGSSARKTTVNPTPSLASWRLYSVTSKSGEWTSYLDGTQLYTTATNTVGIGTAPVIGRSSASYWFDGDIAFFVICSPVITGTDLTNMKTYIANKYALTIS